MLMLMGNAMCECKYKRVVCEILAAEFCRRMRDERLAMMSEANRLTEEIGSLQTDIRLLLQPALLLYTIIYVAYASQ